MVDEWIEVLRYPDAGRSAFEITSIWENNALTEIDRAFPKYLYLYAPHVLTELVLVGIYHEDTQAVFKR